MARLYSHFFRTVQDVSGNIVPGVQGTITLADTPTLATLYGDPEGTIPLPNPLFNSTQYGSFSVYLDTGHYDMAFLKEGYIFEPLEDIQILEASGGVASIVGTTNRVIVSQSTGDIVLSTPQNLHPDATLQFAHLGLGTPGNAGLGLLVATGATFQAPVTVSSSLTVSGTLQANGRINAGIGITLNDYPGDNATGLYGLVNTAGGNNRWNLYLVGTASNYMNGSLHVQGGLGIGGAPQPGYTFYVHGAHTSLAPNVGIGLATGAITATLDVNGTGRVRSTLDVNGAAFFKSTVSVDGALSCVNNVGISGTLYVAGASTFNNTTYSAGLLSCNAGISANGNVYLAGPVGIGTGPTGGYALSVNGTTQFFGGNLVHSGTVQAVDLVATRTYTSRIGVNVSVSGTHYLACNGAAQFFGGVFEVAGAASLTSSLQVTGPCGFGVLPDGANAVSINGILLQFGGVAKKPGGGPWTDSSYRHMKADIAAIDDPLGLLLSQHGRAFVWTEERHAADLPGVRYGFVEDEVTLPQWRFADAQGEVSIAAQGFEALAVEALREIVRRLEALEHTC